MKKIFISAGHSNRVGRDMGASGNGYIEGVETAKIRTRVTQILKQKYGVNAIVDSDDSVLRDTLNFFRNKTTRNCIVIDIHFNAAGSVLATGTETFVDSNPTDFELDLAFALSNVASTTLGIPKRGNFKNRIGVKSEFESHHKKLGWMRLTGENALIEVCFISNKGDMEKYKNNFETYCQNLAVTLYHFSNETHRQLLDRL